jgi:hypothetical protein
VLLISVEDVVEIAPEKRRISLRDPLYLLAESR